MLFKQRFLSGIRDGKITLAFRRWTRPSVRAGGTLRTPVGVLTIETVIPIHESEITATDARRAGYASREDIIAELRQRATGSLYRVKLSYLGADPRIALRAKNNLSAEVLADIHRHLERLDAASRIAPWTKRVLSLIQNHPEIRAGNLAAQVCQDLAAFKMNVRKLKNLGLTESFGTGYRLSPRGRAVLKSFK